MTKNTLFLLAILLRFISNAQTVPTYIPTNGLVGWYPFSGNSNDLSGNGNDGIVNGCVLSNDRFGNSNSSYKFDGIDDYISTPILQNNISEYSISCWIKTSNANIDLCSGGGSIVQSRGPAQQSIGKTFFIHYGDQGQPKLVTGINAESIIYGKVSANNYDNNTWCHIVGTWYSIPNTNLSLSQINLYINGVLISGSTTTVFDPNGPTQSPISSPFITKFGIFEGCIPSQYFNGYIDDIGIWNRALNQSEITQIYTSNTVGIKENQIANSSLYSFQKTVYFTLSLNTKLTLKLFDLTGKIVYNEPAKDKNQINIASGLYFANLVDENKNIVLTKKIIIE